MKQTASAGTKQSQFGRFSFSFAIVKKCEKMVFRKFLRISLIWLILLSAIKCQGERNFKNRRRIHRFLSKFTFAGNFQSYPEEPRGINFRPKELAQCKDYTGRLVEHSRHFVPPGELCMICLCDNGRAKVGSIFSPLNWIINWKSSLSRVEQFFAHRHLTAKTIKRAHRAASLFVWMKSRQ